MSSKPSKDQSFDGAAAVVGSRPCLAGALWRATALAEHPVLGRYAWFYSLRRRVRRFGVLDEEIIQLQRKALAAESV